MASTTTEERPIGEFQAISLDGVGVVEYVQDDATSLKIEAEPEAMALITTEVVDGTLRIQTKVLTVKAIHLKHPPVYTITGPILNALDLRGAGRARIGRLKADQLVVSVDGAGDVQLTNQTLGTCRIKIAGRGPHQGGRDRDGPGDQHHRHRQLLGRSVRRRDGQGQHRRRRPGQSPRHPGPRGRHRRRRLQSPTSATRESPQT